MSHPEFSDKQAGDYKSIDSNTLLTGLLRRQGDHKGRASGDDEARPYSTSAQDLHEVQDSIVGAYPCGRPAR